MGTSVLNNDNRDEIGIISFIIVLVAMAFVFTDCSTKTVGTDDVFTIDLSKKYSQKIIHLQSIAEIEYVPLETTDDVLLDESFMFSSLSDNFIVGWQSKTREVFVFSRNGRIISNFNKIGRSSSEYLYINDIVFDEKNEEIFIVDDRMNRIQVYSLQGEYRRTLSYSNDFSNLRPYNFNDESLLIYDDDERSSMTKLFISTGGSTSLQFADRKKPYMLMSKKDGTIISELNIIIPERYALSFVGEGRMSLFRCPNNRYHGQDFVIADMSSDTIFKLSRNKELRPFFVRKPSVHSSVPLVVWSSFFITDKFAVFSRAAKNESSRDLITAFSCDTLMFVLSTGEINKVSFVNDDFPSDKWTPTIGVQLPTINFVAGLLQMSELFKAYEKKQLKGDLEQLVASLREDDNQIVMIVKFK